MTDKRSRSSGTYPTLSEQMQRFLSAAGWPSDRFPEEGFLQEQWSPAVDVREESDAYVVNADLPGVDPKDIEVTLDNGMLTIQGERKQEREEERGDYHRMERFTGKFARRFALPEAADSDGVEARANKGVLEIRIPKSERAVARKIEIKG